MAERKESELTVITKTKDLCSYVMLITQKSPKHFRFTFVTRMQNLVFDIIENLIKANDTFVTRGDEKGYLARIRYQREAMTDIKILEYISMLAMEQQCILPKQYEQISLKCFDCNNLLGAWMMSDKKRLQF